MLSIKRIIKIHKIEDFKIFCLFNNGESRIIDFQKVFPKWNANLASKADAIINSLEEFQKVELENGALTWNNLQIKTKLFDRVAELPFDLDSTVLYESSEPDMGRKLNIGLMVKQGRKELGLTQEELAKKAGTSKQYISRIENNKSKVELSTLIKIVESGLGKKLQLQVL